MVMQEKDSDRCRITVMTEENGDKRRRFEF